MLQFLRPGFLSVKIEASGGDTNEVVEFNSGHTLVDTGDDLLGDGSCVNVLRVEAITQSRDTSSDLVKLHAFLASVCSGTVSEGS